MNYSLETRSVGWFYFELQIWRNRRESPIILEWNISTLTIVKASIVIHCCHRQPESLLWSTTSLSLCLHTPFQMLYSITKVKLNLLPFKPRLFHFKDTTENVKDLSDYPPAPTRRLKHLSAVSPFVWSSCLIHKAALQGKETVQLPSYVVIWSLTENVLN